MPNANVTEDAMISYRALKERLGHVPSSREFYEVFSRRKLGIAFEDGNAYSQLQQLAGDDPHKFSSPKSSLDDILIRWGSLARDTIRKYNKLPIQNDWIRCGLKPTISGIEKSHKVRWSDLPRLFSGKFDGNMEWRDVLKKIPRTEVDSSDAYDILADEVCYVYLMKDLRNVSHKIGISINPWRRESTLQSEQPKTELIAVKKFVNRTMALAMEKALHSVYGHKRRRGEWFDLTSTDIDELTKTLSDPIG